MANHHKFDWCLRHMRDTMSGKTIKNVCITAEILYLMGLDGDAMRTATKLAEILRTDEPGERADVLCWLHGLRDNVIMEG